MIVYVCSPTPAWFRWVSTWALEMNQDPRAPDVWFPIEPGGGLAWVDGDRYVMAGALNLMTTLSRSGDTFGVWTFGEDGVTARFARNAGLYVGAEVWNFDRLGPVPPEDTFDPRMHPDAKKLVREDLVGEWWRVLERGSSTDA